MSSWTFTRTPAGPHLSSERISFRTAILPLSYPGRRRAVCRAVRPPTRKNLIPEAGFQIGKDWNAGELVESQWSLVANHHLYNLLHMSKMIPSNVGNNSPSPARSWSPWSNVAVASPCLISKKQRTPEGALRSSESLRKRTTLKRDRGWFCWRDEADTPPMLAYYGKSKFTWL